ncbi:MAG: metal-binding protein [Lachnospiraceae bacterium]|nr:metal-binding protein [Lachnospiraceae bacterium]
MDNSFRFFENKDCEFYPCHKNIEHINCLFCYCPFYFQESCPGTPEYIEKNGRRIRVCTDCNFIHEPDNYPNIIKELRNSLGY